MGAKEMGNPPKRRTRQRRQTGNRQERGEVSRVRLHAAWWFFGILIVISCGVAGAVEEDYARDRGIQLGADPRGSEALTRGGRRRAVPQTI